ncbi:PREDICTED: AKT-interacting protein-like [Amphimedon queenslandica]|uniref:UBC core domain-containing protein n=1 Tax=Amphimedon queenslandica TaxID=400682 RepID=A0A1X7VV25_AMPQE|nr:PREDICTED: AKT-interacting protein-like [Amphimedon queenslandica]|eukprot:XP_019849768.1 PREDICTED: AKT-interacting protein-like [Amphimedon queenslandica]
MSLEPTVPDGRKSPLSLSREEVHSKYGCFFQESTVLSEYCQLLEQPIPGVYVLTSNLSPLIWYGLLLIKIGLYEGAVFKFTVSIPMNYPEGGCPRIDFQSGVYHPQVDYDTGLLESKRQFPRWRRDVNKLRDLLLFMKNSFLSVDCDKPVNEEAALLFANDKPEYKERVKKSIRECKQVVLEKSDDNDPHAIEIGQWHHDVMKSARELIFEPEYKTISEEDATKGLPSGLSWVKPNSYTPFSSDKNH